MSKCLRGELLFEERADRLFWLASLNKALSNSLGPDVAIYVPLLFSLTENSDLLSPYINDRLVVIVEFESNSYKYIKTFFLPNDL